MNHVGKIYNLLAHSVAMRAAALPQIRSASCILVGCLGQPVADPQLADLCVEPVIDRAARMLLEEIVREELSRSPGLVASLLNGSLRLY